MSVPTSNGTSQPVFYFPVLVSAPQIPMMIGSVPPNNVNINHPYFPYNAQQVPQLATAREYPPRTAYMPQAPLQSHPQYPSELGSHQNQASHNGNVEVRPSNAGIFSNNLPAPESSKSFWNIVGPEVKMNPSSKSGAIYPAAEVENPNMNIYNPYYSPQIQTHEVKPSWAHPLGSRMHAPERRISFGDSGNCSDIHDLSLPLPPSSGNQIHNQQVHNAREKTWRKKLLADYEEQHQNKISEMLRSQDNHMRFLEGIDTDSVGADTTTNAHPGLSACHPFAIGSPSRGLTDPCLPQGIPELNHEYTKCVGLRQVTSKQSGIETQTKIYAKPSMTYTQMIIVAFVRSDSVNKDPSRGLSTKEICEKIMDLYPYYRYSMPPSFMIVINGALNRGPFRKLNKRGTSCYWGLDPKVDGRRLSIPKLLGSADPALEHSRAFSNEEMRNIPELFVPIEEFSAFNLISGAFLAIPHPVDLSKYQVRNIINFIYPDHHLMTLNKSVMHVMVNNDCFKHVRTVNRLKHFKLDESYAHLYAERAEYLQNRLTGLLIQKRDSGLEKDSGSEDLITVLEKILNPPSPETDVEIPKEYRIKPNHSIHDLVVIALKSSVPEGQGLTVRGICDKIMELFPYYRYYSSDYWRHGISKAVHCDLFEKVSCSRSGVVWKLRSPDSPRGGEKIKVERNIDQKCKLSPIGNEGMPGKIRESIELHKLDVKLEHHRPLPHRLHKQKAA